jgi:hypothetical protein
MENNSTSPPDAVKPAVLRSELEQAQRITSYLARGIRECVNHHNDEISGGIGDTIHSTAKGKINLQRPSGGSRNPLDAGLRELTTARDHRGRPVITRLRLPWETNQFPHLH